MRTKLLQTTIGLLFLWLYPQNPAIAQGKLCSQLFANKQFLSAARCFLMRSKSYDIDKEKYLYGKDIRNAAISFYQASQKEKKPEQASYLKEKASKLLTTYIEQKLCKSNSVCLSAVFLKKKIAKETHYATVTINPIFLGSTFTIRGYKYSTFGKNIQVVKLRPGTYTIRILNLAYNVQDFQRFVVKPGAKLTITLSKKNAKKAREQQLGKHVQQRLKKEKKSIVGDAVFYTGIAAAGLSILPGAMGVRSQMELTSGWRSPEVDIASLTSDADMALGFFVGAGVLIIAGSGLIIAGIVLKRKEKKKSRILQQANKPSIKEKSFLVLEL